jgi:hypothetical protein
MNELKMNPGAHPTAHRPKHHAGWISEFERVYVFGGARIRGEEVSAAGYRESDPPRRRSAG